MNLKILCFLVLCQIFNFQTSFYVETCGKVHVGRGNIVGGKYAIRGAFPWVAALVLNDGSVFCGGTILSKNKVVTAAHCVLGKDNQYELLERDITVIAGAHNLSIAHERGKFSVGVDRIETHRNWNPSSPSFDADIAMLTLVDDIPFNRFIQPICLMDSNSFMTRIWNGYTVGYGKSERDVDSETVLKSVLIPIEPSNEECFYTNEFLMKIASNRSFCGGSRDGSGVCLGDSGNGMFVKYSNVYFLRGIVSSSLYTNSNCDVYNYAIFTNVLKFFDWIVDKASSSDRQYISRTSMRRIEQGTAFCTYEHVTKIQNDLLSEQNTGYQCSLDLDVKGVRIKAIIGSHENDDKDNLVSIIKVIPKFRSYLTTFPTTFCNKFKNLEVIDMIGADIAIVEPNSLDQCKDLRILQFYMNKIQQIPENLLVENKMLQKLYITSNSIKNLPNQLLSGQFELQLLDLSHNKIDQLASQAFKDLQNLESLNLESNKLKTLESTVFKNLKSLEKLNLSDNEISELPRFIFSDLKKLKELYLQNNKLTIIHADSFPENVQIDHVDLSNNQINSIDKNLIDKNGIGALKMLGNICDKTALISKRDMKSQLTTCFKNFRVATETDLDLTTQSIRTTTRNLKTTSTTVRQKTNELEPWIEPCGIPKVPVQNIIGGTEVGKGTHPWIAALIDTNGTYFCGGTLISNRIVVTAAHCVYGKNSVEKTPNDTAVLLGAHKLDDKFEIGRKTYLVSDIRVDRNWNPHARKFDADIAVLKMNEAVKFGAWIQPVCLPKVSQPFRNFEFGEVVGFGKFDKSGQHSNIPRMVNTPIRESDDCYNEFPGLLNIASHKTFCGGYANGTSVCNGDSGGGLTVVQDDVYYLRGIVSASLHGTDYGCDVESYTIFTDIRYYMNFLKAA